MIMTRPSGTASKRTRCSRSRDILRLVTRFVALAVATMAAFGQGWGHREAMRPWLEGRFADAEQIFAAKQNYLGPIMQGPLFYWEAEFETERGHYGLAASLLAKAKRVETLDSAAAEMYEKRLARLYLSVGRFRDAERQALNGRKWDGADIRKLHLQFASSLTTLGEVYLAKGRLVEAAALLERAIKEAKSVSSIDGPEWVRARNGLAVADLGLGSEVIAAQIAEETQRAAAREWGATSIPAMDSLHTIGTILVAAKRMPEAHEALGRSRAFRVALYGRDHPKVAESYMQAAVLASAEGDSVASVEFAKQSLMITKLLAANGVDGRWASALVVAAPLFAKAGDLSLAKQCLSSAVPILERELGSNAPSVDVARRQLASQSGGPPRTN